MIPLPFHHGNPDNRKFLTCSEPASPKLFLWLGTEAIPSQPRPHLLNMKNPLSPKQTPFPLPPEMM